ncbi:MAG: ABC transporter substrate-binding protein [Clostridia bacterium]|nr:ABC transporter substrate-binding protein [Clostridia bacterium]
MINMKKTASLLLILLLMITVCGCSNNTKIYNRLSENNNLSAPEETGESTDSSVAGELTIYTFGTEPQLKYLANKYMQVHPNVVINIVNADHDSETEMIAKLTSGEAGDIIDLEKIDMYKYSGSGLFENLYKYMNDDPDWNEDDYYTNIFKAMEIDDRLLGMPYSFTYTTARFNKTLLNELGYNTDEINEIDCYGIYDIYLKAMRESHYGENIKLSDWAMFDVEIGTFFNPVTDVCDFEGFEKYLSISKEIDAHKIGFTTFSNNPYIDDLTLTENQILKCIYPSPADMNIRQFKFQNDLNSLPVTVIDSDGNIPFTVTQGPYAISSRSAYKDLAWDFLKYCVSDIDYKSKMSRGMDFAGFCINRNTNAQFYDRINVNNTEGLFDDLDAFVDRLSVYSFYNDAGEAIRKEVDKYLRGQNDEIITAENCRKIAEKYMGE